VLAKINNADERRTQLVKEELLKQRDCLVQIASFIDDKNRSSLNQRIKEILN